MSLPKIYRDNNLTMISMSGVTLWFSYNTLVAFRAPGVGRVVQENTWGTTTGKHLNAIDGGDKKSRVDSLRFQILWDEHVAAVA